MSRVVKRSVTLDGHKTSVTLEYEFFGMLYVRSRIATKPQWFR